MIKSDSYCKYSQNHVNETLSERKTINNSILANDSLIMNDYRKLVGDWDYFVIRLRVTLKVYLLIDCLNFLSLFNN